MEVNKKYLEYKDNGHVQSTKHIYMILMLAFLSFFEFI